jgi:hypothetical protein
MDNAFGLHLLFFYVIVRYTTFEISRFLLIKFKRIYTMKIVKIGEFDKSGCPINWHLDMEGAEPGSYAATNDKSTCHCLGLLGDTTSPDCPVTVNGVEIVEWTEKRKAAMIS